MKDRRPLAVVLIAVMSLSPCLLTATDVAIRAQSVRADTSVEDVRRDLGQPEIRTLRVEGNTTLEDLVYRKSDAEYVLLRFADGKLRTNTVVSADSHTPRASVLSAETLQQLGHLWIIAPGWTAVQARSWQKPDDVVAGERMKQLFPAWPGGELWTYHAGPYVTAARVDAGKVVEVSHRFMGDHVRPKSTTPEVRAAANQPPTVATATGGETSPARKFWKGVGTVVAVAAAGVLMYEAAKHGSSSTAGDIIVNSSTRVITNGPIESRIDGEFTGWSGQTVFALQNGQIWRQVGSEYLYHYANSPRATLVRTNVLGQRTLIVEGVRQTITVEQIR